MQNEQNKKFNDIKVGDIVTYYSDLQGSMSQAVVCDVNEKMFTLTTLKHGKKPNGVHAFYEFKMSFYKTGTKTHHRYTFGNAIAITSSINIMGA
jgi:hypothetical protein